TFTLDTPSEASISAWVCKYLTGISSCTADVISSAAALSVVPSLLLFEKRNYIHHCYGQTYASHLSIAQGFIRPN
ncbi:hypothetical protein, partial [Vibrio parahaemolyticus]|uniref:hypothetical protein n=1 Tax=Vibrio parahaemolyticus TaxID=670 RepID=UPI001C60EFC7